MKCRRLHPPWSWTLFYDKEAARLTSTPQPNRARRSPRWVGAPPPGSEGERSPEPPRGARPGQPFPGLTSPAASGRQLVPHLLDVALAFLNLHHFQAFHWDKETQGLPWRHVEDLARLSPGLALRGEDGWLGLLHWSPLRPAAVRLGHGDRRSPPQLRTGDKEISCPKKTRGGNVAAAH